MKISVALVLLATVGIIHGRRIEGEIDAWTNWLIGNLSVRPAMTASIEYHIRYRTGRSRPMITFYYDGLDSPNLHEKCNKEKYGQVHNKDLAVPLNSYPCYTYGCTTKCKFWKWGCKTTCRNWNCEGSIKIQDSEPKSYFFSLGFDCGRRYESLDGLWYNVTIYDESNKTSCLDLKMAQGQGIDQCERSYQYVAIPNQIGDITLNGAISRMNTYLRRSPSELPSKECLEKWKSFLCEIFLPRCLPEENKILLPCRDDCKFYLDGCLNFGGDYFVNCDYLPPCEGKNTVKGGIEEDPTWFLSNLSVRPAKMASIEYNIQYQCSDCLWNERHQNLPIITFYYGGQDSPNLRDKCNSEMHGQLFNKDLAIPLQKNAEKFWCNDKNGGTRKCYGRTQIQDFEPKSYFFSLGFDCNQGKGNLKGLHYEVTIYDESNETNCVDLNKVDLQRIGLCERSYQYAAIPNQFGDTDMDGAISRMKRFSDAERPSTQCLDKLDSFLCKIFLPKCLPEENKIILPCREDCKFYLQGCSHEVIGTAFVNCDYLPPCNGRNSVSGIITNNTTWFLSNLSVRPAITASLEYSIQYLDVEGRARPIITFYYNGQDSPNLQQRCNAEMHGQLFNKDLAVPLNWRHREKFWCNRKGGMKVCHGRTKIQDFEPKSYSFSLGFECNEAKGNINGLKYDITIYDESNKTSCLDVNMTELQQSDPCDRGCQDVAFPNSVGDTDLEEADSTMESVLDVMSLSGEGMIKYRATSIFKLWNELCLKKYKPFLCDIGLPKCLPKENKILLPCKDTCKSLLEDCSLEIFLAIDLNCDYLPPCPPNYLIIGLSVGLSVGACVIVVMVIVCVKYRRGSRMPARPGYPNN